jgi:hypothetical protein
MRFAHQRWPSTTGGETSSSAGRAMARLYLRSRSVGRLTPPTPHVTKMLSDMKQGQLVAGGAWQIAAARAPSGPAGVSLS